MSHRTSMLALAVAYVGLLVASTLVLPWFHVSMGGIGSLDIGLRSATVCSVGKCMDLVLPSRGMSFYALSSGVALWGSMAYSLVVLYQIYCRVSQDYASPDVTRKALPVGLTLLVAGLAVGYMFAPEVGGANAGLGDMNFGFEVSRSMAPLLYVLAHVAGILAMTSASKETVSEAPLSTPAPYTWTPVAPPPPSVPLETAKKDPTPAPTTPAPKLDPISSQHHLRGKLNYVVASCEVTRAGIDARREDGSSQLVLWRDVVGVVVRRTPDDLDGVSFADIVSAAGATLRIVPWSRLTGDATGQGDERLRALATVAQTNREGLVIDGATKKFLAGEPAPQLKDAAMLATHDERLA